MRSAIGLRLPYRSGYWWREAVRARGSWQHLEWDITRKHGAGRGHPDGAGGSSRRYGRRDTSARRVGGENGRRAVERDAGGSGQDVTQTGFELWSLESGTARPVLFQRRQKRPVSTPSDRPSPAAVRRQTINSTDPIKISPKQSPAHNPAAPHPYRNPSTQPTGSPISQ